jgi:hypothetical protein
LPPAEVHRLRLQNVLEKAAGLTRYARDYDPEKMDHRELPAVDLLDFLCHPDRYTVEGKKVKREKLVYPVGNAPRTAVVGREVEESRRVKCFRRMSDPALRQFAPHALAARLDVLRAAEFRGTKTPLRNALIVFSGILEGALTREDGDRLWEQYQVPVFEQFLGIDGELLAWECEVHQGLHVCEEAAYFERGEEDRLLVSFLSNPRLPVLRLDTGLAGRITDEPCACGAAGSRVVDMRRRTARVGAEVQVRRAAVG